MAQRYFGAAPVHVATDVLWSFPLQDHERLEGRQQGTLAFHFDTDDYRALRLFLYLSDVDHGTGPHVCVSGSHRKKRFLHRISPFRQKADEAIEGFYGNDAINTVTGRAGTAFMEDPFCFHKATLPTRSPRLMMMVHLAVRDYGVRPNRRSVDAGSARSDRDHLAPVA